ncbi:MAG: PDDEXK nuclease domain-containing protein [Candidatus Kapabacteria bacterium]|nr:PDDEXK nuclease domain-containing protein [Candidatus Kapabacteria bacterium]
MLKQNMEEINNTKLLISIKELIENSKNNIAISVNAEMTMLYWGIGKQINEEILNEMRAEYGKQIVINLSKNLQLEYGSGWSSKHLRHCLRFAEVFSDSQIVSTLWRQLSWSHIKEIIYIQDSLKRNFYIEMCKMDRWSVRTLRERIDSLLFERTAISKKPDETIQNDLDLLKNSQKLSPDLIFKDPYFLDFLGLKNNYSEKDLESAILSELENFIVELGSDFGFLARQKRITIDNEDYYIDLLFYHRRLRCLVVIELKLGKFSAADKGQVELYLRWLEKHELLEGENPPIGLILCTDKNQEHVELMQLDKSNIRVADYLTELPDKKLLESKLHQSIENAKNRLFQNIEFENK